MRVGIVVVVVFWWFSILIIIISAARKKEEKRRKNIRTRQYYSNPHSSRTPISLPAAVHFGTDILVCQCAIYS
jgi:hypothetical protein